MNRSRAGHTHQSPFRPAISNLEERSAAAPGLLEGLAYAGAGAAAAMATAAATRLWDDPGVARVDYALTDGALTIPQAQWVQPVNPLPVEHPFDTAAPIDDFFAATAHDGPGADLDSLADSGRPVRAGMDYFGLGGPALALAHAPPDAGGLPALADIVGSAGGSTLTDYVVGAFPRGREVEGGGQRPLAAPPAAPATTPAVQPPLGQDELATAAGKKPALAPLGGGGGMQLLAVQPAGGLYYSGSSPGKTVFDMTAENASYSSEVGIFRVDDVEGRLNGILPNTTT